MKLSFADHINVIATAIKPLLMGPGCIESLKELCSLFPFDLSRDFGFESRLGEPMPNCDFSFLIGKGSEGAKILAGENPKADLNERLLADPVWQRIRKFFIEWNKEGARLNSSIGSVWLEFDYDGTRYNPCPNFFSGININPSDERDDQYKEILHTLNEIYSILTGTKFPDEMTETLRKSIQALPEHARLYQTGLMLPRHKEAVRLVIVQINALCLEPYLENIGWPGDFTKARILPDRYSGLYDYFVCNINTGREVHPYLALEMLFNNHNQPRFNKRWETALEVLVYDKLVTTEKREALLDFCGKTQCGFPYPANYIRGLNHLKIVYKPDTPLECKGYFGTMIREG